MKQIKTMLALLLAAMMLFALAACSADGAAQTHSDTATGADAADADASAASPANDGDGSVGMPNPITEYLSLDEINGVVGMKLVRPPVMGVSDESFRIINGDPTIAEYDFTVAGVEYCFRACPSFDEDISGYYINGEPAFGGRAGGEIEFASDGNARLARWATIDGQYVLSAKEASAAFDDIAAELMSLSLPGMSEDELAAFYEGLAGEYWDEYSKRAYMNAEALGSDGLKIVVHWSSSAFEYSEWVMTAKLYEDGLLSYYDCTYKIYVYGDDGSASTEVVSENGSGFFSVTDDGKLLWNGAEDDYCRECVFSKP